MPALPKTNGKLSGLEDALGLSLVRKLPLLLVRLCTGRLLGEEGWQGQAACAYGSTDLWRRIIPTVNSTIYSFCLFLQHRVGDRV